MLYFNISILATFGIGATLAVYGRIQGWFTSPGLLVIMEPAIEPYTGPRPTRFERVLKED